VAPVQRKAIQEQIGQSFAGGFRVVMIIGAGLALLSALFAWMTLDRGRLD